MVNENKEMVMEQPEKPDPKKSRSEIKKSGKILTSHTLGQIAREAEDAPDEISKHRRSREHDRMERHGVEQSGFRKTKLTNRQKKALNLTSKAPVDDFADFRELNDIKAIFGKGGKPQGDKRHKIGKKKR